jgi:hypothetical protein
MKKIKPEYPAPSDLRNYLNAYIDEFIKIQKQVRENTKRINRLEKKD